MQRARHLIVRLGSSEGATAVAQPSGIACEFSALVVSGRGIFFDGRSARPIEVSLRVADGQLILDGPVQRRWDCRDLRAAETVRPIMVVGPARESERVEFSDDAVAAAIAAVAPDLRPPVRIPYRTLGGALAAAALLVVFAIWGLPPVVDLIVPAIPRPFERRLAEVTEQQLVKTLLKPSECRVPAGRAALDEMVATLKIAALDQNPALLPVELEVRVFESSIDNAFALPGGKVIVTSKLIAHAESPDELAGVLAHEFGHVAVRDPTRLMLRDLGWSLLLGFFMGDVTGSTVLVALGNQVITASYGRDAERDADAFAARTMSSAGADVAALAGFLERIAPDYPMLPAFLLSHPFTRERAAVIRAQAAGSRPSQPILDDEAWNALKAICPPRWPPRVPSAPDLER